MKTNSRDIAIKKISEMPKDKVLKVLIFMAGMEAEQDISTDQNKNTSGSKN